jgi:hypothetical protein
MMLNTIKQRKVQERNKLGVTGVAFCKDQEDYKAYTCVGGKYIHLGRFKTLEEARIAAGKGRIEAIKKTIAKLNLELEATLAKLEEE